MTPIRPSVVLSPTLPISFQVNGHSRSPSRSPVRPRFHDDLLGNLSPSIILQALKKRNASGALRASIESASPSQQAFGIRAAAASENIQKWVEELELWPWPEGEGSEGFETQDKRRTHGNASAAVNGATNKSSEEILYWGSLPVMEVLLYEARLDEIAQDMEDLDVEDLKRRVLEQHTPSKSRPSSSNGSGSTSNLPMPSFESYTRLEDFTAAITHIVLQALPSLEKLRWLMSTWTIRLAILRDVQPLMTSMDDVELALKSGWETLDMNQSDKTNPLKKETFDVMRRILQDKVTRVGQKVDFLLDTLAGRPETLPEAWIDRMEDIERNYGEWFASGDQKVREGEWAARLEEEQRLRAQRSDLSNSTPPQHGAVLNGGAMDGEANLVKQADTTEDFTTPEDDAALSTHGAEEKFEAAKGLDKQDFVLIPKGNDLTDTVIEDGDGGETCPRTDSPTLEESSGAARILMAAEKPFDNLVGNPESPSPHTPHTNDRYVNDGPQALEVVTEPSALVSEYDSFASPRNGSNEIEKSSVAVNQLSKANINERPLTVLEGDSETVNDGVELKQPPVSTGSRTSDLDQLDGSSRAKEALKFNDVEMVDVSERGLERPSTPKREIPAPDLFYQQPTTPSDAVAALVSKPLVSPRKVDLGVRPAHQAVVHSSTSREGPHLKTDETPSSVKQVSTMTRSDVPITPFATPSSFTQSSPIRTPSTSSTSGTSKALKSPSNQPRPDQFLQDGGTPRSPSKIPRFGSGFANILRRSSPQVISPIRKTSDPFHLANDVYTDKKSDPTSEATPSLKGVHDHREDSHDFGSRETEPIISVLDNDTTKESDRLSYASTISAYASSPEVHEAEPAEYFKPLLSPVKSIRDPPVRLDKSSADTVAKDTDLPRDSAPYHALGLTKRSSMTDEDVKAVQHYPFGNEILEPGFSGFADGREDADYQPLHSVEKPTHKGRTGSEASTTTITIENTIDESQVVGQASNSISKGKTPRKSDDDFLIFSNYEEFSPTMGRVRLHGDDHDYSPPGSPTLPARRSLFPVESNYDADSLAPSTPQTPASEPGIEDAPVFSSISLMSTPTTPNTAGASKITDSQLHQQIGEILSGLPTRITLATSVNSSPVQVKKRNHAHSTNYRSLASRSATPDPSFTLAPAPSASKTPRYRPVPSNPEIKLYHLSRSNGETPIKLFVRLVGEHGERVMVRVGGGWADLGEYLREYASHHGRKSADVKGGKVEIQDLPNRSVSGSSIGQYSGGRVSRQGGHSSPISRPGSSLEMLGRVSGGSLGVRKTRRSMGEDSRYDTPPSNHTRPSLSPATFGSSPPSGARSSSAMSWRDDGSIGRAPDTELGLAGPKGKRGDISQEKMAWVESMKEKVRVASAEKEKIKEREEEFGRLGRAGATKRLFKKSAG